jgi:D-alanyl-D-alanine dipeptidase
MERTIFFALTATLSACLLTQCGSTPPKQRYKEDTSGKHQVWLGAGQVREVVAAASQRGLVDVKAHIPDIEYELPYRTKKNVCWQPLYPQDMPCLLHIRTVEKLKVAQEILRSKGLGLKIWDAWRPPEVQESLFEHGGYTGMFTPPSLMWSRHCSGTAVDVTLVDASGNELEMPTGFDEADAKTSHNSTLPSEEVKARRLSLQLAMTAAGFSMLDTEWWHFDDAEFDNGGVPPVVRADEVGLTLPTIKKRRAS